jgi:hypothetical protein
MKRIHQEVFEANKENNLPEISRILSVTGADTEAKDSLHGWTPLYWARYNGLQDLQALRGQERTLMKNPVTAGRLL